MTRPDKDTDKLTPVEAWFSAACMAGSIITLIICACVRYFN